MSRDGGQSTAELAIILPALLVLVLVVVQVGVVARDQVAIHHAVAAAARRAAVEPGRGPLVDAAAGAAPGLDRGRLRVTTAGGGRAGDLVTVELHYRSPTEVPLVGRLIGDVELAATAVVRREGSDGG